MEIQIKETELEGVLELSVKLFEDNRGLFIKTYDYKTFSEIGISENFVEEFFTISKKGVFRGMHFQIPPHDHSKLVYCTSGEVVDLVVDLRKESKTFGKTIQFSLSAEKYNMVYIPKGFAHGFYTISDLTTMVYKVSSLHSPDHDTGILWSSLPITLPYQNLIISNRDKSFKTFQDFESPF
jgi:dTDP-4-dehydrorhamnose 3,5-epimerase